MQHDAAATSQPRITRSSWPPHWTRERWPQWLSSLAHFPQLLQPAAAFQTRALLHHCSRARFGVQRHSKIIQTMDSRPGNTCKKWTPELQGCGDVMEVLPCCPMFRDSFAYMLFWFLSRGVSMLNMFDVKSWQKSLSKLSNLVVLSFESLLKFMTFLHLPT